MHSMSSPYDVSALPPSTINPLVPMFAIESTQSHLYGSNGMKSKIIKGTQQFAWTQTQTMIDYKIDEPPTFSWNSILGSENNNSNNNRLSISERSFFTQYLGNNNNVSGGGSNPNDINGSNPLSITQGQLVLFVL